MRRTTEKQEMMTSYEIKTDKKQTDSSTTKYIKKKKTKNKQDNIQERLLFISNFSHTHIHARSCIHTHLNKQKEERNISEEQEQEEQVETTSAKSMWRR